jgi:hypothetical protein
VSDFVAWLVGLSEVVPDTLRELAGFWPFQMWAYSCDPASVQALIFWLVHGYWPF